MKNLLVTLYHFFTELLVNKNKSHFLKNLNKYINTLITLIITPILLRKNIFMNPIIIPNDGIASERYEREASTPSGGVTELY